MPPKTKFKRAAKKPPPSAKRQRQQPPSPSPSPPPEIPPSVPPLSPSPLPDAHKFVSPEAKEWYDTRLDHTILIEKSVAPYMEERYQLKTAFDVLGWGPVLELKGAYYPDLVRQFYANMEPNTKTKGYIFSKVKGVSLHIDSEVIASVLGIPDVGQILEFVPVQDRYVPTIERGWRKEDTADALDVPMGTDRHGLAEVRGKYMEIRHRLLTYLLTTNVMPKRSGGEVRVADLYLVYKMVTGLGTLEGIPLASIIIDAIWAVRWFLKKDKNLVFPLLLSRVMETLRVPVDGEVTKQTTESHVVDDNTLSGLLYKKNGENEWYNPSRRTKAMGPDPADMRHRNPVDEIQAELDEGEQDDIGEANFAQLAMRKQLHIVYKNQKRLEQKVDKLTAHLRKSTACQHKISFKVEQIFNLLKSKEDQ